MGYEIPQQLQHKEKIMFGMTFSQLAWALLFGGISLLILTGNGNITTKFIFALFPATFGVLFVFFDVFKYLQHLFYFFKFREASIENPKMREFIGIQHVEDNIIHSQTEVAILQVIPTNFKIKGDDEQQSIIYGFQRFLNSLDFPIQILVTTNALNVDEYLNYTGLRVKNKDLFKDFKRFIDGIIRRNQMRNRFFYIVIPKKSDLNIQCQVAKERLESIGLKVSRIKDAEILDKLLLFFNEPKNTKNKEDMTKEEIMVEEEKEKTEKEKRDKTSDGLMFLIAPLSITDNVDYFSLHERFCRIISVIGYPRIVESGFLDKIISSNDDFDISIHIEPYSIETTMVMLNKELEKQRADLFAEELKKSINPSLEIKYQDTRKVLEELQKGNEKLFNVSLYINCKAKSKEELDLLTKKVEAELNSMMIVPSIPIFRQIPAYQSMIPIAKDALKIKRNITTKALSAFFPFTSPFLNIDMDGVLLGLNKNKVPYIKNIFGLSNANGLVISSSGGGKSFFSKVLIARQLLHNTKVIVIDPQSEYKGLVQQCDGELITISRTSKTIINPLDLMDHDFIEKRLALIDLFHIMFTELS